MGSAVRRVEYSGVLIVRGGDFGGEVCGSTFVGGGILGSARFGGGSGEVERSSYHDVSIAKGMQRKGHDFSPLALVGFATAQVVAKLLYSTAVLQASLLELFPAFHASYLLSATSEERYLVSWLACSLPETPGCSVRMILTSYLLHYSRCSHLHQYCQLGKTIGWTHCWLSVRVMSNLHVWSWEGLRALTW